MAVNSLAYHAKGIATLDQRLPLERADDLCVTNDAVRVFDNFVQQIALFTSNGSTTKSNAPVLQTSPLVRGTGIAIREGVAPISGSNGCSAQQLRRVRQRHSVRWSPAQSTMAPRRDTPTKRAVVASQADHQNYSDRDDDFQHTPPERRMRLEGELRSKRSHDKRPSSIAKAKGKGKATSSTTRPRKRKSRAVEERSSSEEERRASEREDVFPIAEDESFPSDAEDDADDDNEKTSDDDGKAHMPVARLANVGARTIRKPITVDEIGFPNGKMMKTLREDVRLFAADLDVTMGWDQQDKEDRKRFYERLYEEWRLVGPSKKISDQWLAPLITKALIHARWKVNQLIDSGKKRPADVDLEQWNILSARRKTEESKQISEHMRSISKSKGSRAAQLQAIERDMLVQLTLSNKRRPRPEELEAAVAVEFTRQEEEKRKAVVDPATDIDEVRTRLNAIEESIALHQSKADATQQRFEALLMDVLNGRAVGGTVAIPEVLQQTVLETADDAADVSKECTTFTSAEMNALLESGGDEDTDEGAVQKDDSAITSADARPVVCITSSAEGNEDVLAPAQDSLAKALTSSPVVANRDVVEDITKDRDVNALTTETSVDDGMQLPVPTEENALAAKDDSQARGAGDSTIPPKRILKSQSKGGPAKLNNTFRSPKSLKGATAPKSAENTVKAPAGKKGEASKKK